MPATRLIAVGACAVDTILTTPHYPAEDSKLRATSFSKRRGGNSPNTLEVLQQLIGADHDHDTSEKDGNSQQRLFELCLVATLPARSSVQAGFIASSFSGTNYVDAPQDLDTLSNSTKAPPVDLSQCVYRERYTEPVSSYIISSQSTSSRTIINHNALPEMTFEEFVSHSRHLLEASSAATSQSVHQIWCHFEGRIADTTLKCIRHLREHEVFMGNGSSRPTCKLTISVELEKPGRDGLQDLALEADVVFYSKAWATGEGYHSAEMCLVEQAKVLSASERARVYNRLLVCTWGARGASAVVLNDHPSPTTPQSQGSATHGGVIHSRAYTSQDLRVVDSTGAGDTFIAGMLFGLICRAADEESKVRGWSLRQVLDFANGLAGRKILHDGFRGLGESSRRLRQALDSDAT